MHWEKKVENPFMNMSNFQLKKRTSSILLRSIYLTIIFGIGCILVFAFNLPTACVGIALIPLYYKGMSKSEREKLYRNETFFDKIIFYALVATFAVCLLIVIIAAFCLLLGQY